MPQLSIQRFISCQRKLQIANILLHVILIQNGHAAPHHCVSKPGFCSSSTAQEELNLLVHGLNERHF